MRLRTAPFAIALVLLAPAAPAVAAPPQPAATAQDGKLDATGRYIVVVEDSADPVTVRSRHAKRDGLKADATFRKAVRGFAGRLTDAQLQSLRRDPDVAAVVPDEIIQVAAQTLPTGISRIGGTGSPVAKIDGIDDRVDADVAIVDTGIDPTHADLNVVGGINCTTSDRTAWADAHGHGTHVAGTVGARDNGYGVVGVAPGVRLWSVRVLNSQGFGYVSWYVCGLDWITAQRDPDDTSRPLIEAANMSVAKDGSDDRNCGRTNNDLIHQAVCRLVASGVTVAVAAGNASRNAATMIPAAYDEVITVSALADSDGKPGGLGGTRCYSWGTYDVDDTFADFSNYGADVDLIAPGKCIWSTLPGGTYGYMSGTSMATPHVTGAIALYKASRPWATPAQVKSALQYLGSTNWKTSTDPDTQHEKLLDVSRLGPMGDFTTTLGSVTPAAVVEAGGATTVTVKLARTPTHFESISVSADGVSGITPLAAPVRVMGFTATTASVAVNVPAGLPAGTYPVTITATDGPHRDQVTAQITVTNDIPTAKPPTASPAYKSALGGASTAPLRVAWPAATDPTSGIAKYEIETSVDGGSWTRVGTAIGSSILHSVAVGHSHRFRVRAQDTAGNWSPWAEGQAISVGLVQDSSASIRYSPGWYRATSSYASGGVLHYTTRAGASARLTTTARQLAIVAPVGPTRGGAGVYVDGVLQAKISLYSSTGASRKILWAKAFASGTHTIEIRALGTSGRPRIDLDAIVVIR